MISNTKCEFDSICKDILGNTKFNKLKHELHHGITRYEHSLRVAKTVFKWAKKIKLPNYKDVTRAALLHDFYTNAEMKNIGAYEKLSIHPSLALNNAKKYYKINDVQEDIIKNHMFPMTRELPKTKEGIMVSLVDKGVAAYEMCRYKLAMQLSVLMLFIINVINIQN